MKLRKVFSILAISLMPIAIIALLLSPVIVQIGTPDGLFVHIDAMFECAGVFFLESFFLLLEANPMAIASLSSLLVILTIITLWIVFAIVKKHKSVLAIIFGSIIMLAEYYLLIIFVFNIDDIVYKGTTEYAGFGSPLFLALQPFDNRFHPIFGYGLFASFVTSGLSFLFVLAAFLADVCSKKVVPAQPKVIQAPQVEEATVATPAPQSNVTDDEKLRQIIREEIARHNGQVSEEDLVEAVAVPEEEHVVEDAQPAEVLEETTPAPSLDDEPKYNKLDPIEKIFAEIESNRPELENPLPKKGEIPTNEKKEEPKPEEMTIEEKMEAGIVDPKVVKEVEAEEDDEIEHLEDEHLD